MKGDLILKDESVEVKGRLETVNIKCSNVEYSGHMDGGHAQLKGLEVNGNVTCDALNVKGANVLAHLVKLEEIINEALIRTGDKVHGTFTDVQISGELWVHGTEFGQRLLNLERKLDEVSQRLKALEG